MVKHENVDRLWKEYFKNPWLWSDNVRIKNSSVLATFRHRNALECLWIHDRCNPSWICAELTRRVFPLLSSRCEEVKSENYEEKSSLVSLLKVYGREKDIHRGIMLHKDISKKGFLDRSPYLASALIVMYAKCGFLSKAQEVLKEHSFQNAALWNALISEYVKQGRYDGALNLFQQMQSEGCFPDSITYICILKACATTGNITKGKEIHDMIMNGTLLEKDIVLGTSLVNMYAKCSLLTKAQEVLEGLPVRNVVSWNTLITGYAEQGQCLEALNCFELMQSEGIRPDVVTFICILKVCGSGGALEKGRQIHDEVVSCGLLEKDVMLGATLVNMYAKCGALEKAYQILKELPVRDVVSWSALIAGYSQKGQLPEALNCFEQMQQEGLSPDVVTFIYVLNACGSARAIEKGEAIHEDIINKGLLEKDIVLGNALVDMYVKCGFLEKAQKFLKELPIQDALSWSTLIAGYVQQGRHHEALNCFEQMQNGGNTPDIVTFIYVLKACSTTTNIDKGKEIHCEITSRGLFGRDVMLGNALLDMYAKCSVLDKAREVLEELPIRDVISWSALIAGYAQQEKCWEALNCYQELQSEGFFPDAVTFLSILKACASTGDIGTGKQIHEEILSQNLLGKDIMLGTALVDMYAKCGALEKAQQVLLEFPSRDVILWNALISGYAQHGYILEALECFELLQSEGLCPNAVTFICILKACGSKGAVEDGERIYNEIMNRGFLGKDITLGNALVDMYAKCGILAKAQKVLEALPVRDLVSWNSILAGYAQQGQCEEALKCLAGMQNDDVCPDAVSFICILKACGNAGAMDKGEHVHDEIVNRGLLEKDVILGNALVDMYTKCGILAKAKQVLEELPARDIVTWNTVIAGYADRGHGHEALDCFKRMRNEGIVPDEITFLSLLSACNHTGLVQDAQVLFGDMSEKYGVTPSLEHHTCMVMVFGCAGKFEKAIAVIHAMPSSDYSTVWLALLSSCKKWGNVKLGRLAFDQAVQLDKSCAIAYVLMANIFLSNGMQEDAERVDAMRQKYAPWQENDEQKPWIDADGSWKYTFTL